jgi:NAD(P)-dependent dehydrogenase (short-subunit alcohol dehydrogenase family)
MALNGLQDRVVVVTGGAGGIGQATAARLVAEGARVALVDLDLAAAQRAAEAFGDAAIAIAADVASEGDVEECFAQTAAHFGRVDCLHANAGIEAAGGPITETEMIDVDRVIAVNLRGVYLCLREMLRRAHAQGAPASIVVTSSGTAVRGMPGIAAYAATKAAVISLTRTAARESATAGIRVNAVAPGPVDTALWDQMPRDFQARVLATIPLGRPGRTEEIAALVAWLLSDESAYVTGAVYAIDGGETA